MDGLHKLDLTLLAATSSPTRKLAAAVLDGASVLFVGQAGMADSLHVVEHMLGAVRTRVLRVHPPLELRAFMEQVASASPAPGQNALERGFESLTALDANCDRIVLLVEDAHLLPHPTLRYIEMAFRAGPHLQVVLAGQPALVETLALAGFASLQQRLSVQVGAAEPRPDPLPAAVAVATPTRRRWHPAVLTGVLAASTALVMWSFHPFPIAPTLPTVVAADTAIKPVLRPLPLLDVAEAVAMQTPVLTLEAVPTLKPGAPVIVAQVPDAPANKPAQLPLRASPVPDAASSSALVADAPLSAPALSLDLASPVVVTAVPTPVLPAPPLPARPLVAVTTPQPRQVLMRPALVRPERVVSLAPAPAQNERRCRDIVLRAQLGESPNDGDRTFLRNGCR